MKNRGRLIYAGSLAVFTLLVTSPALAEGVPAGTLIRNTASATYSDGAAPQTVESNTVTVQVDELLDVTSTWQDGSAIPVSPGTSVLTFEITNTGNGPEAFELTADPSVAGNDFDVTVEGIAYDTNGNGIYDEGVDIILGAGEATPSIDPDQSLTVFVLVSSPSDATDGQTSSVDLIAEAVTGTGAPGTVFAGQGEGGSDAVAGTTGADTRSNGDLTASIARVSLVKTASVENPYNSDEAIPGAIVTYSIVASVEGSGSISGLTVTDVIPNNTSYQAGSLTLDGTSLTDPDDSDAGRASASGISVDIGTAAAGTNHTVTFDVIINPN